MRSIQRLLVATDGSAESRRAAEHAVALARALGGRLIALSVIESVTVAGAPSLMSGSIAPHYASLLTALREAAKHAAAEVAAVAGRAGVECETEVVEGHAAAAILEAAARHGADLIVMGTHGRTRLGALFLGSTAQAVVHGAGATPVLLVR